MLLYFLFPRAPISVFMNEGSQAALTTGVQFLRIVSPFYLVIVVKLIADGVLRGAGLMSQFMISTFTDLLLRVVLCIGLSSAFGVVGIWCSWPIGWIIGTGLSLWFYRGFTRRLGRP